ncbi:hypothetical protein [Kitasatospora sp. NPDC002040]|uniref:hypothetical protein n=1 Tax=Kitasatospora sp. NPDC002040 TaxID=3154661 RepID=UPI00332F2E69
MPKPVLGTAAATVLAVLLLTGAAPADQPVPRLSVALDNGRDQADSGDRVTWTLTVRNLGPEPATELRIEQSLPSGATPARSADSATSADATVLGGTASWQHVSLAGGTEKKLTFTADLPPADARTLRSASTACVYPADSPAPVVCASDLDLLPAGRRALADAARPAGAPPAYWWTAAALPVLAIGAYLAYRRRFRTTASS